MLHRIKELLDSDKNFSFETTLATKSYKNKIVEAKQKGYNVILLFFWLESYELAIERVKTRVLEGGHNIPKDVIKRRYFNGINNLFTIYLGIVDQALIFDNSEGNHVLIAEKSLSENIVIFEQEKFNLLLNYYEQRR